MSPAQCIWLAAGMLVASALPAFAGETIVLDGSYSLVVTEDAKATTSTTSLNYVGKLVEAITIGNATLAETTKGAFCPDGAVSTVVVVDDATSTYGATTAIIAYKEGLGWWLSTNAPGVYDVAEPDDKGRRWITDNGPHAEHRRYCLLKGKLVPK